MDGRVDGWDGRDGRMKRREGKEEETQLHDHQTDMTLGLLGEAAYKITVTRSYLLRISWESFGYCNRTTK